MAPGRDRPHDEPYSIAVIQSRAGPDPEQNLRRAADHLRTAAARGARLVILPELFRTQYFCQREDASLFTEAEPIPGPTTAVLARQAKELSIVIITSLFERRAPGVYHNTAIVLDQSGDLVGTYRKMHIPDDPRYYEKFYFTPGDLGFPSIHTSLGPVGPLICWDQWFPEAARASTLAGAELLAYPTAIGWHPAEKEEVGEAQRDAWTTVQRAHAIANGSYVAVANRVGLEHGDIRGNRADGDGIEFWGSSFIADPLGRMICRAGSSEEEVLLATVDPDLIERTRQHWPFLRDRRIDAYGSLNRRWVDSMGSADL
ncbi:MAG: carbon-nitrogen hydrolase [Thermoplasmata archaeon]